MSGSACDHFASAGNMVASNQMIPFPVLRWLRPRDNARMPNLNKLTPAQRWRYEQRREYLTAWGNHDPAEAHDAAMRYAVEGDAAPLLAVRIDEWDACLYVRVSR